MGARVGGNSVTCASGAPVHGVVPRIAGCGVVFGQMQRGVGLSGRVNAMSKITYTLASSGGLAALDAGATLREPRPSGDVWLLGGLRSA